MAPKIERVDTIPLIIAIFKKMGVQRVIDGIFIAYGNLSGLSYGQLTVLFVTYVLHSLTHRFSWMEPWLNQHKAVIERAMGWRVGEKDATDDLLGRLAEVLGESDEGISECQLRMGQGIISAYQLPTGFVRYDTTSFNVHHHPENGKNGILEFGHSKNCRPDLLQFKQVLTKLNPAEIPILSETFPVIAPPIPGICWCKNSGRLFSHRRVRWSESPLLKGTALGRCHPHMGSHRSVNVTRGRRRPVIFPEADPRRLYASL